MSKIHIDTTTEKDHVLLTFSAHTEREVLTDALHTVLHLLRANCKHNHVATVQLETTVETAYELEDTIQRMLEDYTLPPVPFTPIDGVHTDPFLLEKNLHINEDEIHRAVDQLRRQRDRSAAGVSTPTAATNDTSADAQSFRDSITEISRQLIMPFVLMIDKHEGLKYEDEKAQTLIFQMEDDIKQIPSTDVYISDSVYARSIAMGALWLLLQRHHAADPIRNIPAFSMAIMSRIVSMLVKKNHDYGNSFGDQLAEDGPIVFKIRLKDKVSRLKTLLTTEAQVKDESIEDNLRDIIGYCILFLHHYQTH